MSGCEDKNMADPVDGRPSAHVIEVGVVQENPTSQAVRRTVIDLFCFIPYMGTNRTRPASVRKDMHTGRVFYFGAPCRTVAAI